MAIGERIHFFRIMRGMTQKYLGMEMGFPEGSADVRMAQYETGSRTPKADLTKTLADYFEISTNALTVPDIDTDIGLIHTLFVLEDIHGLTIGETDGKICLCLDKEKGHPLVKMMSVWAEQAEKLKDGEITKDEYDCWRYNYPKCDSTQHWAKTPSEELSDTLVKAFKDKLDE